MSFASLALVGQAASAANLMARVDANGTLLSGGGVASVTKLGPGIYEVGFAIDVSACAFVATTASVGAQAMQAYTAGGHLDALKGVYVETKNQGGGLQDRPFDLVVNCSTKGMQQAVVGYAANLVRSSPGVIMNALGGGRYNLRFPARVSSCAYLATVGDPGNALVFNPAGVYTGSGPDSYTVYVETKNPGGGLSAGIPFHLSVICSSSPRSYVGVVNDSGLIARGSSLTSAFRNSTGNYTFVTKANIAQNCATVATRGSTNKAVPFNPATIEIASGPASNTRGLQVRDLLFFGGNLANEAFHTASVCP
jgi:hypothetical protein